MIYTYIMFALNILFIVILLIIIYSKSYVNEKGKNLATREDIQNITEKIEIIKIQYSKELEETRALLQKGILRNNQWLENSTKVLLSFYDKILLLGHDKLRQSFGDIGGDDQMKQILKYQADTEQLFRDITIEYHRLLIFMDDNKELLLAAENNLKVIIKLNTIFKKHIGKRKLAFYGESEGFNKSESLYKSAVEHNDYITGEYLKEFNPLYSELQSKLEVFIVLLMKYFKQNPN